jgi:hypothetical protein
MIVGTEEFRKQMKKYMDMALNGELVTIERHDIKYILKVQLPGKKK